MFFHSARKYLLTAAHSYTSVQPLFTPPVNGGNLPPQYLPDDSSDIEDDMDCSPLSPPLMTDVEMDILTDTPPATSSYDHTPWNTIAEYVSVPPFDYNAFVTPPPLSIWQTAVQEPPHSATRHDSGVMPPALYASSFHTTSYWDAAAHGTAHAFVSVAQEPAVDSNVSPHAYDTGPTSDGVQNSAEVQWQEPPPRIGTPHPISVASLVDEFEQLFTLVTHSEADDWCDLDGDCEPTRLREDPPQRNDSDVPPVGSEGHTDNSSAFKMEATELHEEGQNVTPTCFLNLHDPSLLSFERELTAALEQDEDQPPEREPTELVEECEDQPASSLPVPRPPTPPPSRRRSKPARRDADTVPATTGDHAGPPVAQTSVQACQLVQQLRHPADGRAPPPLCLAQVGECGWVLGGPSKRRTALGLVRRPPAASRCRKGRGEEEVGAGRGERRVRKKRIRFVVPETEEGVGEAGAAGTRRTGGPGPLRSILRNRHTMPYDKTKVRRRASVP